MTTQTANYTEITHHFYFCLLFSDKNNHLNQEICLITKLLPYRILGHFEKMSPEEKTFYSNTIVNAGKISIKIDDIRVFEDSLKINSFDCIYPFDNKKNIVYAITLENSLNLPINKEDFRYIDSSVRSLTSVGIGTN